MKKVWKIYNFFFSVGNISRTVYSQSLTHNIYAFNIIAQMIDQSMIDQSKAFIVEHFCELFEWRNVRGRTSVLLMLLTIIYYFSCTCTSVWIHSRRQVHHYIWHYWKHCRSRSPDINMRHERELWSEKTHDVRPIANTRTYLLQWNILNIDIIFEENMVSSYCCDLETHDLQWNQRNI